MIFKSTNYFFVTRTTKKTNDNYNILYFYDNRIMTRVSRKHLSICGRKLYIH